MAESGSVVEPGRSYHPLTGQAASADSTSPALRERRAAITELGDALRELVEQASATEVPVDVLRQVAAQLGEASAALASRPARGPICRAPTT